MSEKPKVSGGISNIRHNGKITITTWRKQVKEALKIIRIIKRGGMIHRAQNEKDYNIMWKNIKEHESLQLSIHTQMQHSYQCVEHQQRCSRIGKKETKSSVTACICMKQVKEALKIAKYLLHARIEG